jgi:putative endonuclease
VSSRFYYTYIVASRSPVIYVGVTGDLERRAAEHKEGCCGGFTAAYSRDRLVWFERYSSPGAAIAREKQLKGWLRAKKVALIQMVNPSWDDLSADWGRSFL